MISLVSQTLHKLHKNFLVIVSYTDKIIFIIFLHTVPDVMVDDLGEPDYSTLTNHKPGQLYAVREAMNITVLRTLSISAEMINIGIQDAAAGVYTCVAINGLETNSSEVTIQPTGEHNYGMIHFL